MVWRRSPHRGVAVRSRSRADLTELRRPTTLRRMDDSHLKALLDAADVKQDGEWSVAADDRTFTFHVSSSSGVGLNIGKVSRVRAKGGLLFAETVRGELYVLSLGEVFAGSVEGAQDHGRKAGFQP